MKSNATVITICAFGLFLIIQITLIFYFRPTVLDFKARAHVSGIYHFDGGAVRTPSSSFVGKVRIYSGASYMGSDTARFVADAQDSLVNGEIAKYKTLFGEDSVVMNIYIQGRRVVHYTEEERVRQWWEDSLMTALQMALIFGMACRGLLAFIK